MTIRHTSRRAVAPTVVQSSDSKGQLPRVPCRCQPATGRRKWGAVGLHDIAGDVYHQSIITFLAPVSGIDIHIGSEHRYHIGEWVSEQCFTSPQTQYRLYGRRFLQVKRPNQQYQSTEGSSTQEAKLSLGMPTVLPKIVRVTWPRQRPLLGNFICAPARLCPYKAVYQIWSL